MDAQERRCTGSTVCRGRMDAQERRCTGCTVCRGRMDAQERRCTGCTVCRGCRTTYRDVLVSREAGCWERLHRSGDVQGRTGRCLLDNQFRTLSTAYVRVSVLQYLHFHHPCGRSRERTTTGMWEIEQRREQRSRKTKPGSGDSRILYPG